MLVITNGLRKDISEEQTSLQKILGRYPMFNLHDPFPSKVWWQIFFDKGILDVQELEQSLLNSKYFQDENTPDWVRLWHFSYLNDDEFDNLLKKVESEYADRQFLELGVIKHITGLFLMFSDAGLYYKSKEEILQNSKLYIDHLKYDNRLDIASRSVYSSEERLGSYKGLGFQGKDFREFTELCSYIDEVIKLAIVQNMANVGQDLLTTMQSDVWKFREMICLTENWNVSVQRYYEIPILKNIKPAAFIEKLLPMTFDDQRCVGWTLTDRYKFDDINEKLLEELEWLKSVRRLLLEEANCRKGKVSGFSLELLTKHYLNEAIEKLEAKSSGMK
ncbi:hypothetical protein [uncultured Nostoc sp.]|uniref:hypothetical protein n=1 Tax=uncultured Nostoc sp. TaxID=340711 RepID=UPI0035CB8EBC